MPTLKSVLQFIMSQHSTSFSAAECDPAPLPPWVYAIPGVPVLVDELGATEFRRRLLHMLPALVPLGLPFTPHSDIWEPWLFLGTLVFAAVGLVTAVLLAPWVTRPGEENWPSAVLGYVGPLLGTFLLFPGRTELALMTLHIVALGDGSAVLGGKLLKGPELPWNSRKTFSGLACFVAISSLSATYSYWGEARPTVSVATAFMICSGAALCAGIAESLPLKSADNFRVGTTAAVTGTVLSWWLA
jgi:dolichol kinase